MMKVSWTNRLWFLKEEEYFDMGHWDGAFYIKITVNQAQRKAIAKGGWKRAGSSAWQWTQLWSSHLSHLQAHIPVLGAFFFFPFLVLGFPFEIIQFLPQIYVFNGSGSVEIKI